MLLLDSSTLPRRPECSHSVCDVTDGNAREAKSKWRNRAQITMSSVLHARHFWPEFELGRSSDVLSPLYEHPARNDWSLIVNLPFLAKRYLQFHISTIGEGESTRRYRSIPKLILFTVSQLNISVKRLRNRYQCVTPVQMLFICSRTSSLRID